MGRNKPDQPGSYPRRLTEELLAYPMHHYIIRIFEPPTAIDTCIPCFETLH